MSDHTYTLSAHDAARLARVEQIVSRMPQGERRGRVRQPLILAQSMIRRFELKYSKDADDSSATAYVLPYEDGYDDPDVDDEFEVYDPFGCFRGRGNNVYAEPHHNGSRGYATYRSDADRWEIIWMVPNALMLEGSLTAALGGDTYFDINYVRIMQPGGGIICDQDPADDIRIYNPFNWIADYQSHCIAVWNEYRERWEATQIECPG